MRAKAVNSRRRNGQKLANVTLEDLGRAKRMQIEKEATTIIGGTGAPRTIDARTQAIQRQIKETTSDYDREKLQERIAKLSGALRSSRWALPPKSR